MRYFNLFALTASLMLATQSTQAVEIIDQEFSEKLPKVKGALKQIDKSDIPPSQRKLTLRKLRLEIQKPLPDVLVNIIWDFLGYEVKKSNKGKIQKNNAIFLRNEFKKGNREFCFLYLKYDLTMIFPLSVYQVLKEVNTNNEVLNLSWTDLEGFHFSPGIEVISNVHFTGAILRDVVFGNAVSLLKKINFDTADLTGASMHSFIMDCSFKDTTMKNVELSRVLTN